MSSRPPTRVRGRSGSTGPRSRARRYCWLYGVVRHQVLDEIRKATGATRSLDREISMPDDSVAEVVLGLVRSQTTPSGVAVRREEAALVRRALARLKPRDCEIITMRVLDDLTFPEIVGILGRPENTVTQRYHRALHKLLVQLVRPGPPRGGFRRPMNEHPTSSMETGSDDAVLGQFLRDLDGAPDDAAFADIVARAKALHPGRDEEFDALVAGLARPRGLRDPDRLGPYRVRRVLAVGGMGKLYEAVEDKLGRVVVVKTIKSSRAADPHYQDRFDRERRALARLHHANIVPIYATGQESGLFYFSMPRIHGPSLRALIRRASSLGTGTASPIPSSSFDSLIDEASAEEERELAGRVRGGDTADPAPAPDAPRATTAPSRPSRPTTGAGPPP